MDTFLQITAQDIYRQFGNDIASLAIVFPNKRPAIYFRQELGRLLQQPVWSPDLYTIYEFIEQSTHLLPADRFVQSFVLYDAYVTVAGQQGADALSYESFYAMGEILLNDFNEIDAYLVDATSLYSYLQQVEQIEKGFDYLTEEQQSLLKRFWKTFSAERLSSQQEKFIRLWGMLPDIYTLFHQQLQTQNLATYGNIYRTLATDIKHQTFFTNRWKKIVFVGFNALNKAEEIFLKKLQEDGKALFYFDTDPLYLDDAIHEAGLFLRRNIQRTGLKNSFPVGPSLINDKEKTISIVSASGTTAQAHLLPQLLKQWKHDPEKPETAILLADEKMLMPVLHALENDVPVNITMGFPLPQSNLFTLIRSFLHLQEQLGRSSKEKIYYKDINALLLHPLLHIRDQKLLKIVQQLQDDNQVWVPVSFLLQQPHELMELLFRPATTNEALLLRLLQLLEWIAQTGRKFTDIETTLLKETFQAVTRVAGLFRENLRTVSVSFACSILMKILQTITIPLEGEPLRGIQIMGLLESRALDFKNIILLGANEGILPKAAAAPSFIPDSIRRAFGLSVTENQDAIFAYVFYRLLQRSENIHLLYNHIVDEQSTGEYTRFIRQLQYETEADIRFQQLKQSLLPSGTNVISIPKEGKVWGTLQGYLSGVKGLTPSAINAYIDCRLKFYFSKVAGLEAPQEMMEKIDAATFGNILHHCMEKLYGDLRKEKKSGLVTAADITLLRTRLDGQVDISFAKTMLKKEAAQYEFSGNEHIIREVVKQYAQRILDADERYAPFEIVQMEKWMDATYSFSVNDRIQYIKLGGYMDRVDRKNDIYRIVDYKTGSDKKEVVLDAITVRDGDANNKAALQTILYAWIVQQNLNITSGSIEPALYNVREMNDRNFDWRFFHKNNKDSRLDAAATAVVLQSLQPGMDELLGELFDPAIPFDQTTKVEKCGYCDFRELCNR
ncbi:PD-(D/E)XK nuclease family protein [Chitinophagaceae bacterium MMS25-I14]